MARDLTTPPAPPAPGAGFAALTAVGSPACSPAWLDLREPADAAARAADLVALLVPALAAPTPDRPLRVHDLGAGTGSMVRWLAPRLPGPRHWVLHERDDDLLARAEAPAGDTVEPRPGDATRPDLAGADLVVASALLDLLTAAEVDAVADAVDDAGCPALLTLTVTGDVTVDPPHPRDPVLAAAFDDHQRRDVDGRRLLGPDAGPTAAAALRARGMTVHTRPSPWRLGPDDQALAHEWLAGWLDAALAQRPDLADPADPAADLAALRRAGALVRAEVGHVDVLALPRVR